MSSYRLGRHHDDTVYLQLGDQPADTDPRVALFMGPAAAEDARTFIDAANRTVTRLQAARDEDGASWWIHDCGEVIRNFDRPGPHGCEACDHAPGPWRQLYLRPVGGDVLDG